MHAVFPRLSFVLGLTLTLCLSSSNVTAQYNPFHVPKNLPDRDSLKAIIQTTNNPIQKLDALRELGHAYYENKRDSALFFFEQSVATAKQINSRLWEADAFNSLGFVSYILGNYPRALQFLNQAKTIAEDAGSEKGEWRSNPSGFVAPHVARLSILARSYQHLATLYSYTRSSADTGSSDLSLGLYRKALAISTSIEDTTMMGIINMNTSRFFSLENELDSVVFYHKRALQLMNAAGYTRYIGNVMYIMGEAYRKHQQPETAKIFYWYGMEQGKNIENTRSAADNSLALANLLLAQGNTDSAIFYGYSAAELYKSTLILSGLADSYATLSSAFNAKNKIDSAFHYQGLSLSARKQLDAEDNSRRFQQLAFDEKLKAQEAAERERLARNRIIMIILLSGLAILAAIGIFLYRNNIARKKANQLLAGKNRELEIEASLDRVRTRALAMHSSGELLEVANVLREQMGLLNQPELETSAILIFHDDLKSWDSWHAFRPTRDARGKVRTGTATFSRDACAFTREIFDHYLLPQTEYTLQVSGAKREEWITVLMNAAPEIAENAVNDEIANFPTTYFHFSDFTGGSLLTVSYQPPSNEIKSLQQRAAKVFDLAFRRFLDLKKAESQAREAQIEAALEKVRSRSMAMHKSEELKEVIQLVYDQMLHLKMPVEHTGFIIDYKQRDDMHIWLADMNSTPVEVSFPYFDAPHWNSYIEAKKTGASFFANHHSFEEKNAFYTKLFDLLPGVLDDVRDFYFKCPGLDVSTVLLDNIGLYIENFSGNPYTDEENAILMRFGKVFQQAYTRFIDLQKAEASAREAQIEAALERIRSRSMAMHKSEELADLSLELVKQVQALGVATWFCAFNIYDDDTNSSLEWGSNGQGVFSKYRTPREGVFLRYYEAGQRGETLLINEIGEKECPAHYEYLCSVPGVGDQLLNMKAAGIPFPTHQIDHVAFFKYGYIIFITYEPVPETHDIFKRFARVFEQSYTRFLDLKNAEAQAKEAQIEAALERVRSRSLAMHHTDELQDVVNVAAQQLLKMNIDIDGGLFIAINDEVKDDLPFWAAAGAADYVQKVTLPYLDRPTFTGLRDAILRREPFYTEHYSNEEKNEFMNHMFLHHPWNQNSDEKKRELLAREGGYTRSLVVNRYTSIGITNHHGKIFSDADNAVLKRFGAVVEQSYTRFLDLQKAEAQAREAQIEAALERVRSRTIGMQRSDELKDAAMLMLQQVLALNVPAFGCGFNIWDEDRKAATAWMAGQDRFQPPFKTSSSEDIFLRISKACQNGDLLFVEEQGGESLKAHYDYMNSIPVFKEIADKMASVGQTFPTFQIMHCAFFPQGYLMFITFEPVPSAYDIFKRFAKVFEQTYTRFLDLQKAEAQAREAQIEAALEKVRSRTLAMQRSDELGEVASILFKQMNQLVHNLWTCGFVLCEKDRTEDEWWLSMDGDFTRGFFLPNVDDYAHAALYEGWLKGETARSVQLDGEALQQHYDWLMEIPVARKIFEEMDAAGLARPDWQKLHAAYFSKGYLVLITREPCAEEEIFKRFAAVFNLAYTRFKDLQISEAHALQAEKDLIAIKEAKQKAEVALTELQATQKQLIQAEKMASLGELTAGIAHEIQNPLNFVNNFSSLNTELVTELKEAISSGNWADAEEIIGMLSENEEKILQHGKRADAIVKGMLQHTRSGSGTKEPTDINALCDEYLRLAFHGFRAKDKSFNSDFNFTADPDLGKINAVPQEIGRVILNLISNAFYAVHEKAKSSGRDYQPAVKVMTSKTDGMVVIAVADNGTGIPQKVVDKIFQPFFTTKPTGEGTGLGLSLSYDIVKAHGGELKVETKEGEGTAFVISLPANSV